MTDAPVGPSADIDRPSDDRLDSWKEIAAYVRRDVKTVQRWEKREGMPIHRHVHDRMGSVYAFRNELDTWSQNRRLTHPGTFATASETVAVLPGVAAGPGVRQWVLIAGIVAILTVAVVVALFRPGEPTLNLADALFQHVTDFPGIEQAAAISPDGNLVAFLSDRGGAMDVWLNRLGTDEFHNLTKGSVRDIANSDVRTVAFSPDGAFVTFWVRQQASGQSTNSIWAVPVIGGSSRPYLDAAEFDWSRDGRLVYHTSVDGDPMFVREAGQASKPRQIFAAQDGLHNHFQIWSPDDAYIYFVHGRPSEQMDIWRIRRAGGVPERITHHDGVVVYPVLLNARTLAYAASDRDGSGPWLHTVDVEERMPQRVRIGVDRFTSLAASGDGRRLVATVASPRGTLWRLPLGSKGLTKPLDAQRISLTTGNGSSPRLGDGFLLYVSSRGTSDFIWKLEASGGVRELWNAADTRVVGGPAISRDGRLIAFTIRGPDGRMQLSVANIDGTAARIIPTQLELQGAPAWGPEGTTITVAARVDGVPRLFNVALDGSSSRVVDEHSVDPAWSPDGDLIAFSGADVGTTFPLKVATSDGRPYPMPRDIRLTRGARHVMFVPRQRMILVLKGQLRHKNIWSVDLTTGAEQPLTDFEPGFEIRDFDISPDGRELVVEQVQEHSDIVLLDLRRVTRKSSFRGPQACRFRAVSGFKLLQFLHLLVQRKLRLHRLASGGAKRPIQAGLSFISRDARLLRAAPEVGMFLPKRFLPGDRLLQIMHFNDPRSKPRLVDGCLNS